MFLILIRYGIANSEEKKPTKAATPTTDYRHLFVHMRLLYSPSQGKQIYPCLPTGLEKDRNFLVTVYSFTSVICTYVRAWEQHCHSQPTSIHREKVLSIDPAMCQGSSFTFTFTVETQNSHLCLRWSGYYLYLFIFFTFHLILPPVSHTCSSPHVQLCTVHIVCMCI